MENRTRSSGELWKRSVPSRSTRCLRRAGASFRITMSSRSLDTSRPRRAANRRIVLPRSSLASSSETSTAMSKSLSSRAVPRVRLPNRKPRRIPGISARASARRAAASSAFWVLTNQTYPTPTSRATRPAGGDVNFSIQLIRFFGTRTPSALFLVLIGMEVKMNRWLK